MLVITDNHITIGIIDFVPHDISTSDCESSIFEGLIIFSKYILSSDHL